ncbi:hypothetical protein HY469_00065 [Candidatus Roizmanbacteria bacterium]|nr:hypothetical protein [Candidatus Roizmanbacteria bacterium]
MRTLIGLAILLIVILGLVWYMQRDESFVSKLFNRPDSQQDSDEESSEEVGSETAENGEPTAEALLVCTPELFAQDCGATQNPVCSLDTVVRSDGSESASRTEYISACHYCKFFGSDHVVELGDERVETQGYTVGSCGGEAVIPSDQKGGN